MRTRAALKRAVSRYDCHFVFQPGSKEAIEPQNTLTTAATRGKETERSGSYCWTADGAGRMSMSVIVCCGRVSSRGHR